LAKLDRGWLHARWEAPEGVPQQAGAALGKTDPHSLV
jgi:hypothetical protein